MVQKTAIVRQLLTATGADFTDFTVPGFGTPTAAIFVVCAAGAVNPQANSQIAIGFWDGTNQRGIGAYSQDNVANAICVRCASGIKAIVGAASSASLQYGYQASAITDGVRLTMVDDATGLQRHCTCILISGVNAKVITFTPNTTLAGTANSGSIGFTPKLILTAGIGHSAGGQFADFSSWAFGVARCSDLHQKLVAQSATNAVTTSQVCLSMVNTECMGQVSGDATNWRGELTAAGADDFTITTKVNSSGGDIVYCLVLGGDDLLFDIGVLTTPTVTSVVTIPTIVEPESLLIVSTLAIDNTTQITGNSECASIGMANAVAQYSHNATDGDAIAPTNTQSVSTADRVIDLDIENAGFSNIIDATVDSLNAADFKLNYSAVSASSRLGWWLAFGVSEAVEEDSGSNLLMGSWV